MLYIGEILGRGGPEVDIAVDPVEGTKITAKGLPNAITVIAMSEKGGLVGAPDMHMQKLVAGKVSLDFPVEASLRIVAAQGRGLGGHSGSASARGEVREAEARGASCPIARPSSSGLGQWA